MGRYRAIGVIKNEPFFSNEKLDGFLAGIAALKRHGTWTKNDLLSLFTDVLSNFNHKETGKYLDQRM